MKVYCFANLLESKLSFHLFCRLVQILIVEQNNCSLYYISVFDDPSDETEMTEFKASVVAFEVQKNFASKFFSNTTVVKSLIDDTSSNLLDNLNLLLYVFVIKDQANFHHLFSSTLRPKTRRNQRKPPKTS